MADIIPVFPNRPATIQLGSVTEFISIHDAYFFAEKRRRREDLLKHHPDRANQLRMLRPPSRRGPHPTGYTFRTKQASFKHWYLQERVWYWTRGQLMPPDWRGNPAPPPIRDTAHLGRLSA